MRKMKKFNLLALATAIIFTLAACSGGGGSNGGSGNSGNTGTPSNPSETNDNKSGNNGSNSSGEKIELSFWTLGNVNYEELAQEYMAEHQNIVIKVQNTGDQTAHHTNLTTALSAGSGAPDIFQMEIAFVERFMPSQDKFHNLYDLGAQEIKDDYIDWKWAQAESLDGSFLLGLPTDIGPTVVYYRTDVVEQAGLPADPAAFGAEIDTWDKFAAVAKKFNEQTGKPFTESRDLIYNALRDQSDGEIYYSKEDGSFIGDQNPQVKKAYDYTAKGIQEGWVGNYGLWTAEWNAGMNDGAFATVPGPAWMLGNVKDNSPDAAGLWRIAQLPEGAGNWGGSFITLPKEGKHPEEAYAFIEWMLSKENQLKSFYDDNLMPSHLEAYEDEEFLNKEDPHLGGQKPAPEFLNSFQRVKPVYYGPLHDQTDSRIKEALQNVQELGADPEAEWEAAIRDIKNRIAR